MRVTINDLLTASEWLRQNEGTDGEEQTCERVADWLDREISRRIEDNAAARIAKAAGVPRHKARVALANQVFNDE